MNNKQNGTAAAAAHSAYEGKVGVEAVARSGGKNPQLKGVVHEILVRDRISASPENLVSGTKGVLSKSSTAIRDDVLTMRGGSVTGRAQLKDTVSASGLQKTLKQAASGKYKGTNLMGTKETTEMYNAAVEKIAKAGGKVPQKMTSTGVSSADTSRIAAQTVGGTLKAASVAQAALSSAGFGALLSGGIEAVASGAKLANGEIDGAEFGTNVLRETVGGGVSAAGATAAGSAAAFGTATLLAGTTAPVWLPAAVGIGATMAVGAGIKSAFDTLCEGSLEDVGDKILSGIDDAGDSVCDFIDSASDIICDGLDMIFSLFD